MRELNNNFLAFAGAAQTRPRITIAINFEDDGSDILWLTSHDENQRPTGGGVNAVDGCLKNFTPTPQRIDPASNKSSIGSISFDLVDIDGEISDFFALKESEGKSPREKLVQVYYGYGPRMVGPEDSSAPGQLESLDWVDFELEYTMPFKSYEVTTTGYKVVADDVQRLEKKEIFVLDKTTLRQTIDAETLLIPCALVLPTNRFQVLEHDASYDDRPGETVGYAKLGNEWFCHNGFVDDAELGICFNVVERNVLGTQPQGHAVDDNAPLDRRPAIEELVYLEGPILKLLYAVQTGVLYGQGGATLPDNWHQGIPTNLVRLSDYENADPLLWNPSANTGRELSFIGEKKQSGEQFITEQILPVLGCIRPVYSDGAIGIKKLVPVLPESGYVRELTDADIVSKSISSLRHDLPDVLNEISIDWDWSALQEQFLQPTTLIDVDSIAKYKKGKTKRYQLRGLRSSKETGQTIRNMFDALRSRFAGGGLTLKAHALPHVRGLEVGDTIRLTTSMIRDPLRGGTFDRVCEILETSRDSRTGKLKLLLFASVNAPGSFETISQTNVLDNAYYSLEGTDLATFPEIVDGVVTADITLTGGETMGDGIYYYLGDLTQGTGSPAPVITGTDNVFLKVLGFCTRGMINLVGGGHAGGAGATLFTLNSSTILSNLHTDASRALSYLKDNHPDLATNEQQGVPGVLGNSVPSNYAMGNYSVSNDWYGILYAHIDQNITRGNSDTFSRLPIINRDGSRLEGINDLDLRGTSGSGSRPFIRLRNGEGGDGWDYEIASPGLDGADGPGGFILLCRGETSNAGTQIDLSGSNGEYAALNGNTFPASEPVDFSFTGSGGSMPGGFYLLLDGNVTHNTSTDNVTQNRGLSGIHPSTSVALLGTRGNEDQATLVWLEDNADGDLFDLNFGRSQTPQVDVGETGFYVQYVPSPENIGSVTRPPKYQLQNFIAPVTLTSGNDTMQRLNDGTIQERIRVDFLPSTESQAIDYEVQAKFWGEPDSEYLTVNIVTNNWAYFNVEEGEAYQVRVRVRGNSSEVDPSDWVSSGQHVAAGKSELPATPTGMSFSHANDGRCLINFDQHPDADFWRFVITNFDPWPSGTVLAAAEQLQFDLGYLSPNTYTLHGVAQDTSGNNSAEDSVTFNIPSVSFPTANIMYEGGRVRLDITPGGSHPYPVDYYTLFYGGAEIARFSDETHLREINWVGSRDFGIRQTLRGGFNGTTNTITVNPSPPAAPTVTAQPYGSDVTIFYSSVPGDLPVKKYLLYVGATFETAVLYNEKAGDSGFTLKKETTPGTITYWVVAQDSAKNLSAPGSTSVQVSGDDFTLFNDFDAQPSFGGAITNGRLSGSALLLLIDNDMTWATYAAQYTTPQSRHNAGNIYFLPTSNTASYVETFDAGVIIPTTQINTTVVSDAYQGSPGVTWSIAYSDDNSTWSSEDSSGSIVGEDVRYVRLTINATGDGNDIARILSASVQLSIQEQSESGTVVCSSGDSGGTAITFAKNWLDITSITATVYGTSSHKVVVNFSDVPNPSAPQFLIFNDSGTRQNGTVSYQIRGIVAV
jgi:hypothetical protein